MIRRRTLGDGIGESLRNRENEEDRGCEKGGRICWNRCGLDEEFAGRYPHEVSGGQCQRAAIATGAWQSEPKVLICDEATSCFGCDNAETDYGASGQN